MLGACSKCPTFTALKPKESISGITWWQWNSNENGRVEKQELTGEIVFNSLKNYISIFWGTHTSRGSNHLHLRRKWKVSKLTMKKSSFKLILLKILQLKYKMPSSHPTGFQNNLLSLRRVYGKKMVVIHMLLSQIICYMISML